MTARSTTMGSWTIPALTAACVLLTAPRPAPAAPSPEPRAAEFRIAQADTASQDDDDDDEEEVPIPANLLEPSKGAAPAETLHSVPPGVPGERDSSAISLPARPETLRFVPPGDPAAKGPTAGAPTPVPKKGGGLLGLTPTVVLLGLVALHVMVIRTVGK